MAFAITGSTSMLAESVHSVADSGNQALLLLGRSRAGRAQTEEHPFGFGRERYFYAFVVAVVLFTVGALFSIYEGIHKIMHPEPVHSPAVAFAVLAIAIVLESLSLRTAVRESSEQRNGDNWLAFIRRARQLGFSLGEIGDPLGAGDGRSTDDVIRAAEAKLVTLRSKAALLREFGEFF